ncbi:Uncharacterised protein [BD1-7 clade bacterium]|uniref:Uncharacterized protein n=1 Tax=BD1-7 clade bacterium TaxID=2029982 RepID=A0A5S9QHC3_9GAMM|nr:Uncharacterised protein [BD1-7 clade bacterium]CAA0116860.1 Uncharacterised protein [BD1-7 clade bacterium]
MSVFERVPGFFVLARLLSLLASFADKLAAISLTISAQGCSY